MENEILNFISLIRDTAPKEISKIFSCGGCYRFYEILKDRFKEVTPYKVGYRSNKDNSSFKANHIVSKIGDKFYDIEGEFILEKRDNYNVINTMNEKDIKKAEKFKYSII